MLCPSCNRPHATSLARLNNFRECRRRIASHATDLDFRAYLITECIATTANTEAAINGFADLVDLTIRLRVSEAFPVRPLLWVRPQTLPGVDKRIASIRGQLIVGDQRYMRDIDLPATAMISNFDMFVFDTALVRDTRDQIVIHAMNAAKITD